MTEHKPDCARSIDDMGLAPCTCNADKLTPPAPTEAEVWEARERFANDDLPLVLRLDAGNTIFAALDKAQEAEHTASWKEQMAVEERDALRAENARLVEERDYYRTCAVEQDYGRKDFICAMWTKVDRYEKDRDTLNAESAAQAEQIKRLQNALEHIGNTSNEARIMAVAGIALKEVST